MKTWLPERLALRALLLILSLVVGFHLLILLGIIPYSIVWGGRLQSPEQMYRFETVSIALNLLMLAVVAARAGWLPLRLNPKILATALAVMCGLFAANTVGNLFSTNGFERAFFTPLTLVLAVLSYRAALGPAPNAARQPE
ncbi:hypothetical protein [Hymenobacter sp. B81]|uniref:hypothetical protein n=1 Tax=Hymenobacter sp. B81 TaxID=3344878 RepID=UPI0037DCA455